MLVADLPIFAELALANRPTVILGADLLAGRRLVIDPIDHRVYFSTGSNSYVHRFFGRSFAAATAAQKSAGLSFVSSVI